MSSLENPESVLGEISTADLSPADHCVCDGNKRFRPPEILLEILRIQQNNTCVYHNGPPVECVAHLCHNSPCRNPRHLKGSCKHCNTVRSNEARAAKNKRYAKGLVSVSVARGGAGERESPETDPVKINRLKEPWFKKLLTSSLFFGEAGPMEKRDFCRRMARILGLSIVTIRDRYLEKYIDDLVRIVVKDGIEYVDLRRGPEK